MEVEAISTEEKIIQASFRVLQREGIAKTTTKKIAAEAEVSEVTLFRKFKTKQKLIEIAKDYYAEYFLEKLNQMFDYAENDDLTTYLKNSFNNVINITENELNIMKVAMEEVRDVPSENKVISKISDMIIPKLESFLKIQIEKGNIREINPTVLALNIYSIIFESIILWKVYGKSPKYELDRYANDFLDILLNGISK